MIIMCWWKCPSVMIVWRGRADCIGVVMGVMERERRERIHYTTLPVYRHPSTGTDFQCKDFRNILAKHNSISADDDNLMGF